MTSKWINRLRTVMLLWAFAAFAGLVTIAYFTHSPNDASDIWQSSSQPHVVQSVLVLTYMLLAVMIYIPLYSAVDLKRRLGFAGLFLFILTGLSCMFGWLAVFRPHPWFYMATPVLITSFISTYLMYLKVKRELRLMGIY